MANHLISLAFLLVVSASVVGANPVGSTGCSKKFWLFHGRAGYCWRYCNGNSGNWCYTSYDCRRDENVCAQKTTCGGYGCGGSAEGCIVTCPNNQVPAISQPNGSTGCKKKYSFWWRTKGTCWRFCNGSSGSWCYTSTSYDECSSDEEICAKYSTCSGSCNWESGCVQKCLEAPLSCSAIRQSQIRHISKRASHDVFRDVDCVRLIGIYREGFDRGLDGDINSPIQEYYTTGGARIPEGVRQIPTMVHAQLRRTCRRADIGDFVGNEWEVNMNAMNRRRNDERGHLIAAQVCGPPVWWNLAPQTPGLNRNVERHGWIAWKHLEKTWADFINNRCGWVDVHVILNYPGAAHEFHRPKGFKACMTYHGVDGTTYDAQGYFDNEE